MRLNINGFDAKAFDARSPWIGVGRSVIALAQLTILLFAPINAFLVPVLQRTDAPYCDGFQSVSMLCVGRDLGGPEVWRWVMIAVLVTVLIGIFPRWTAIPHLWVSFTLFQSISLPDGGESVAQIFTLVLVPVLLLDDRKWHWSWPTTETTATKKGVTLALVMLMRVQLAVVYIHGGLSKVGTDAWLNGTAEFYIAHSNNFGVSGLLAPAFQWFVSLPIGTALITWGTIVMETLLGVLFLGAARWRVIGLVLGIILHAGIILTIGLWSFGLIMIGVVILATGLNRGQTIRLIARAKALFTSPEEQKEAKAPQPVS